MYHDLFDLCFGLYLFQTSNNMYMIPNEYVIKTMFLFMIFCFIFSFYKHWLPRNITMHDKYSIMRYVNQVIKRGCG